MANIGSRKQITFDLCQEALKKYYPHSLTQAYYDIRRFMESHGFEHRQSSAYVSLDKMTTLDVVSLAEQLAMALPGQHTQGIFMPESGILQWSGDPSGTQNCLCPVSPCVNMRGPI